MKRKIYTCFFILTIGFVINLIGQENIPYKESDLINILNQKNIDSILALERLVAFEFHKLLNEYRESNNLNTLEWNETLWLTCRNHNKYMTYYGVLGHSENDTGKYFTGDSPGDRLEYVQNNTKDLSWSGENALYNYSSNGYNTKDIAKNIARASFIQWKNSPGHNRNMLSSRHSLHGAAFAISGTKVYATSLFGYSLSNSNNYTNYTNNSEKTLSEKPSNSYKKISIGQVRKNLEKSMMNYIVSNMSIQTKRQDRVLKESARKQVMYMAYNNLVEHEQQRNLKAFYGNDLAKRIAKAEGKFLWFFANKTSVKEFITSFETSEKYFDEETVKYHLIEQLIKQHNLSDTQIEQMGFYIKIKRKKSKIIVYAALLINE